MNRSTERNRPSPARTTLAIFATIPLVTGLVTWGTDGDVAGRSETPLGSSTVPESPAQAAKKKRALAHAREMRASAGRRTTINVALDEGVAGAAEASTSKRDGEAALAVDGDGTTAWRGATGEEGWTWTLPFSRVVHLGLIRAHFGDSPGHGVPAEYRWEALVPSEEGCAAPRGWEPIPGGEHRDHDPNTFLYGPKDVHAQKQALFADLDACGLRLVVTLTDGGVGPVLREVKILESARSLTRAGGVSVEASSHAELEGVGPEGMVDGTYENAWAGAPRRGPWTVTIRLPEAHVIDRVRLLLGADATTTERRDGPGQTFAAALLPQSYRLLTSPDDDDAHFVEVGEGAPPTLHGSPLPARRRLVRFSERPVKALRMEIASATGPDGERDGDATAPVIREIGIYEAADPHPVVTEPLFLSVDANPAGLLDHRRGGERAADALVARDAAHRLRRIVLGFDADTAWPVNQARRRDASAGRFLQSIEGDDPLLRRELLEAVAPPPVVMLSGSFDWEYAAKTAPPTRSRPWAWDPTATAESPARGMGLLRDVVRGRVTPLMGFCGGAQILALLDAPPPPPGTNAFDAVLVRNENQLLRGQPSNERHHERVWWSDWAFTDVSRPRVFFLPHDPLFETGDAAWSRNVTSELPLSHGDMLRTTAFEGPLGDLQIVAASSLCAPWVESTGPEPTWPDPTDPRSTCVAVPQAFRSRPAPGYPIIGFQFHPEQRDLQRLAPGSPTDARGDALNVFANSLDLILESYVEQFWSGALRMDAVPPHLGDEKRWYAEHAALVISTSKWAILGTAAGIVVGLATRLFLWTLLNVTTWTRRSTDAGVPVFFFLPVALPACVWLIRRFAPSAEGHGTEAVIAAVHQRSGKIDWRVAPVKLLATVVTLGAGGSVGKEGPCAQIGAALTSLLADILRLKDEDRRRLVICGISAGFAAVFGTPVSGALFGIEVLYLGRIEYTVLFPCLIAGIVSHLVCGGAPPIAGVYETVETLGRTKLIALAILFGAIFGILALVLIETMRGMEKALRRFEKHPYRVAVGGGLFLAAFYSLFGDVYAGLGTATIEQALSGTARIALFAFALKIVASAVTLETGGSGGILTPIFFIGATGGAALGHAMGLPSATFAAFGFVSVLAAAANTPLAAAVMGMELLPGPIGVYAALCGGTAYLLVGHRSVYASQRLGFSKSAGLDMELDVPIHEADMRVRPGSFTDRALRASDSLRDRVRRKRPPDADE